MTLEACFGHNSEMYQIQIGLSGVKEKDAGLSASKQTLCVEGSQEGAVLFGCFTLAHPVNVNKAKASYKKGLLTVEIPMKAPVKGKKIKID